MTMRDDSGERAGPSPASGAVSHQEPIAVVGIGCRFPGRASEPGQLLEPAGIRRRRHYGNPTRPLGSWHVFTIRILRSRGRFIRAGAGSSRVSTDSTPISSAFRREKPRAWTLSSACFSKWPMRRSRTRACRLEKIAGSRTAVFVGISSFDYSVLETSFRDRGAIDAYCNTGGSLSIAANRISYCFDFRGPSAAVDTACSSALVAVHLACRSIWHDGCPLALAGGVNALAAARLVRRVLPDGDVIAGWAVQGFRRPCRRLRAQRRRRHGRAQAAARRRSPMATAFTRSFAGVPSTRTAAPPA